jgi:hypothetical protein
MAFETKQQVFEKIVAQERPVCPHCGEVMNLWEVPPVACDDGLGWGSPYLYMCFNDECPLYLEGWKNIEENYGRTASYRCLCYPDSLKFECMSVFGPFGGKGQIVDEAAMARQKEIDIRVKAGMEELEARRTSGDGERMLQVLLDATEPPRLRNRAAELIGESGGVDMIDTLRSTPFDNDIIGKKVTASIKRIHERFFTRECPFCAEIIKSRAKICKHCNREVAGL